MQLFDYDSKTQLPIIDPIVYQLKPFRKLVDRDKSKTKARAKQELAFIWFYCDYKSDFSSEVDKQKKEAEIKRVLDLPGTWKLDKTMEEAIEFYQEITKTPATALLDRTKKTISKLSDFMESIDFTQEDKSGKPKYDMKKVVDTTTQIPKLIATLREIEEKVKEEQETLEKNIRGNKDLEYLEDGIPL